jgi:hypothetical protein
MNNKISIRGNKWEDGILISTTYIYNDKLVEGHIQELNNEEISELIEVLKIYQLKYINCSEKRTSKKGHLILDLNKKENIL